MNLKAGEPFKAGELVVKGRELFRVIQEAVDQEDLLVERVGYWHDPPSNMLSVYYRPCNPCLQSPMVFRRPTEAELVSIVADRLTQP